MEDLRIQLLEDATYIAWLNEEHAEQCLTEEEWQLRYEDHDDNGNIIEISHDNSQEDELPF